MRAIRVHEYGGPDVMKLEDVPVPELSEGEVLVRIEAAGVNPVDTYIREGVHATTPELPFTPGKDGAGIVESVGGGVTRVKPGDRVYLAGSVSGTYAEYSLCFENQAWGLPENVPFARGAGIFVPYATAYRALFHKAEAKSGETVLVHGASGSVGLAAIQLAKHAGLKVIGTAGSAEGRQLALDAGADEVFDHSSEPRHGYLDSIAAATGGGVKIILEMLANKNLQEDFRALAKFGRIVIIGNRGSLEFNPRLAMGKEATIRGMSLFNASETEMREINGALAKGLEEGYLLPFVGKELPLEDAPAAHREIIGSKARGKIVLIP